MCGIVGISNHKDAARLTYLSLYALQHRGEEGAGIVAYNGKKLSFHKGTGLVGDVFDEKKIKALPGHLAIGHNRYSTTGVSHLKNVQPFLVHPVKSLPEQGARLKGEQFNGVNPVKSLPDGRQAPGGAAKPLFNRVNYSKFPIAIAHNGNLVNTAKLHSQLEKEGAIFQTTMDSEIIAHLLAKSRQKNYKDVVVDALKQIEGSYSLVLMLNDLLVGARDRYGFRPLCLGKLDNSYVLASETCALDLIQAKYIREIEPGEIVFINKNNIESVKPFSKRKHSLCIFEYIYFARPDSDIFGNNVYLTRKCLGRQLAREHPVQADLVMPIPDSGSYAAVGFAQESRIPFEIGMIRNHYVGRTFIQPSQFIRDFKVKVKLNPMKDVLKNKRIVIIEDSIVRGTTSRLRVKTLRQAGAKEVHMRVSCPPIKFPCFYGIDFPTKKELIASKRTVEEIKDFIGLDSLKYLSMEGMLRSMSLPKEEFCTACFNGVYPVKHPKRLSKNVLEKK